MGARSIWSLGALPPLTARARGAGLHKTASEKLGILSLARPGYPLPMAAYTLLVYYPHWQGQARPVRLEGTLEEAIAEAEGWARKTPVGTLLVLTEAGGSKDLWHGEGEATRGG